ncbi:hypothetical protein ACHAXN_005921 [Cyclotella atomus]
MFMSVLRELERNIYADAVLKRGRKKILLILISVSIWRESWRRKWLVILHLHQSPWKNLRQKQLSLGFNPLS